MEDKYSQVWALLNQLQFGRVSAGTNQTAYAAALCMEQPGRLHSLGEVYQATADRYKTGYAEVERGVREVARDIWEMKHPQLRQLIGCQLSREPGPDLFLGILVSASARAQRQNGGEGFEDMLGA